MIKKNFLKKRKICITVINVTIKTWKEGHISKVAYMIKFDIIDIFMYICA